MSAVEDFRFFWPQPRNVVFFPTFLAFLKNGGRRVLRCICGRVLRCICGRVLRCICGRLLLFVLRYWQHQGEELEPPGRT